MAVPLKVGRLMLVGDGVWASVEPQAPPVATVKGSAAEEVRESSVTSSTAAVAV